ncbi:hypothetical protein F53441_6019 [Fusarium austroafricanum]|uniref:Uncharacterized protein n=1 Tax=Fusarium austroafricanum TaxID=2364996 RepID=A0A8H4KKN9_9HYPO|nr:hypothetical protein F53441_6019 [Fusarium austroafricanum]
MLGEPDYWAPVAIWKRFQGGRGIPRLEYCYQHPRYTIHSRQEPCSVYISHNILSETANYITTSGTTEPWVMRAKARIRTYLPNSVKASDNMLDVSSAVSSEIRDPFLLQSILCHESLMEARQPITVLRHQLYDVLDLVDQYSKTPFDRSNLKDITNRLHGISQNADSLYVSAEMGTMVSEHCVKSRRKLLEAYLNRPPEGEITSVRMPKSTNIWESEVPFTFDISKRGTFTRLSGSTVASAMNGDNEAHSPLQRSSEELSSHKQNSGFADSNVGNALDYIVESLNSQKRWLQSYKPRKDIAMNLVFNLVTQHDSETSTRNDQDSIPCSFEIIRESSVWVLHRHVRTWLRPSVIRCVALIEAIIIMFTVRHKTRVEDCRHDAQSHHRSAKEQGVEREARNFGDESGVQVEYRCRAPS